MPTYYVDSVNGLDTNGGSSWADAWQTLKHSFADGDVISIAKSVETAAAGTVTATKGSVTVTTTNDLTGVISQYTVIRISNDPTIYMVQAITSTTITLYRPYRGTTGSGYGITYYTGLPTSAGGDWQPTAMIGAPNNFITVQGGINPSNNQQDGFTILYGNNAANEVIKGTWQYTNISRVATLHWNYGGWGANIVDSIISSCFNFRSGAYGPGYGGGWYRSKINGFVNELSYFGYNFTIKYSEIDGLETAHPSQAGMYFQATFIQNLFKNWKNAGYSGQAAIRLQASAYKSNRFLDAVFDELASGCPNFLVGSADVYIDDEGLVFINPTIGSGSLYSFYSTYSGYGLTGYIRLSQVNGNPDDERIIIGSGTGHYNKYALLTKDLSTYHSAAPSAKISLYQPSNPILLRHFIPCDAGIQKTVSLWMMKNASYGSNGAGTAQPIMRLHWLTGTTGALVSNVQDVSLADNTNWQQLSQTITPSVKGMVIMELIFQSANAGATVWYDDIEVS